MSGPGANADEHTIAAMADSIAVDPRTTERLQSLRDQVTGILNEEFNVVTADLTQLRRLLADAAGKLSGTFRVVTAGNVDMRATIAAVKGAPDMAVLDRIRTIAEEMSSTTGTTIQSLQFEDMASQLLQHVDRKLAVLSRLAKDMAVTHPTANLQSPLLRGDQLDELFAKLEGYRGELTLATRKVVQQESLESGEIELF